MNATRTTFPLIESLAPIYENYGEEQIIAALYFLMQREYVDLHEDDIVSLSQISERHEDIEELLNKWEFRDGP